MLPLEEVQQRYANLKHEMGRLSEQNVNIVAVTKTFPKEIYEYCISLGIHDVGENKVQEMISKIDSSAALFKEHSQSDTLKTHLIGQLQTNKVKFIKGYVDNFDALSSVKCLNKINSIFSNSSPLAVLIQVNSTQEENKAGIPLRNEKEILELAFACESSDKVILEGLMSMGPTPSDPKNWQERLYLKQVKDSFQKTFRLKQRVEQELGRKLPRLSMGMSHDFKAALEEGSNEIRVGSLLFGSR